MDLPSTDRESRRRFAAVGVGAFLTLGWIWLTLAPSASGYVYFANFNGDQSIGRASLDGSGVEAGFIANARHPCGVAVDSAHIYWANLNGDRGGPPVPGGGIGRANLDGTAVNQDLIPKADFPCGVAVDGAHVYWANRGNPFGGVPGTSIGRANLDGTGVDQSFILAGKGTAPCGVAVDAAHVYWGNYLGNTIGRANLDGTGANPSFITGANGPCGVAVDGSHLYWTNSGNTGGFSAPFNSSGIGRANLDGTGVEQNFLPSGLGPLGVAVDAGHVYWTNFFTPYSVGRSSLDGSAVDQSLTGAANGAGVAVDALSPSAFTFGRTIYRGARGIAFIFVDVPGPGSIALAGKGVRGSFPGAARISAAHVVSEAGEVRILVRARGKAKRTLTRTGAVRLHVRVTYTPVGGASVSHTRTVRLKKAR
jgi:hypothetical protein